MNLPHLKTWSQTSVDWYNSCRFDRIDLNRQHFQPTLHSPPEVKIHEITIHEPSSFLKRGHKLQSIRMIRARIDNIFNPPSKSRSTLFSKSHANRLPACRIDRRGSNSCRFDGIEFTNPFPVCQIANTKDEWTLVGCIGQPSESKCETILMKMTLICMKMKLHVELIFI